MPGPVQHLAIIMDGNGRWAQGRRHTRIFGHIRGAKRVREVTEECVRLQLKALTLYTFSMENWLRPKQEVDALMKLLSRYVRQERQTILKNNIRFQCIGFMDLVPDWIRLEIEWLSSDSAKNTGMILTLALSYGSRQELTQVCKGIAADVLAGRIKPDEINEQTIAKKLFTVNLPDPDLLIRTGGDQRISNFLLWQSAYTELYFTETPWPEFCIKELGRALEVYSCRERRFGKTSLQIAEAAEKDRFLYDNPTG